MRRKKCANAFHFLEWKARILYLILKKDFLYPTVKKKAHIEKEGGIGFVSYFKHCFLL